MSKIPLLSNMTVDVILAALRAGNYIGDDASVDTIRSVSPSTTEAERDTLASTLTYGSGSGASTYLSSNEDVNIFIDADNTDPVAGYTNVFRVISGQNTTSGIIGHNQRFTIKYESSNPFKTTAFIGAPGPELLVIPASAQDWPAVLSMGANSPAGSSDTRENLTIAASSATTFVWSSSNGFYIGSAYGTLQLTAPESITFNLGFTPRGGFQNDKGKPTFFVGQYSTSDALVIEKHSASSKDYQIRNNDSSSEHTLNIVGRDWGAAQSRTRVAINGYLSGVGDLNPATTSIGGGYLIGGSGGTDNTHQTSLLIVNPLVVAERRCGLMVYSVSDGPLDDTHFVNFDCNIDVVSNPSPKARLLSTTARDGTDKIITFEVRAVGSNPNVFGLGFTSVGQDVAENFPVAGQPEDYAAGTVMVISADSKLIAAEGKASTRVVGITSTSPGVMLGDAIATNTVGKVVPVAVAGTTPTRCTTANGDIAYGDLLVSYPGGLACKSDEPSVPGTIIGKALSSLSQSGDDPKEEIIRALVTTH